MQYNWFGLKKPEHWDLFEHGSYRADETIQDRDLRLAENAHNSMYPVYIGGFMALSGFIDRNPRGSMIWVLGGAAFSAWGFVLYKTGSTYINRNARKVLEKIENVDRKTLPLAAGSLDYLMSSLDK